MCVYAGMLCVCVCVCVSVCVCVCGMCVCTYFFCVGELFQVLCLVYRLIQVLLQKIGVEIELGFILAMSRLLSDRKKRSTDVCCTDVLAV